MTAASSHSDVTCHPLLVQYLIPVWAVSCPAVHATSLTQTVIGGAPSNNLQAGCPCWGWIRWTNIGCTWYSIVVDVEQVVSSCGTTFCISISTVHCDHSSLRSNCFFCMVSTCQSSKSVERHAKDIGWGALYSMQEVLICAGWGLPVIFLWSKSLLNW